MPTLTIDVAARLASLHDSLDQVGRRTEQMTRKLDKAFGAVKTSLGALGAGLSVGAFAAFVRSGVDAADNLGKVSQQVGITTESLSALNYAAELSGSSSEQLQQALTKLSKASADAAAGTGEALGAFKALNVAVKDSSGNLRSTEDVLLDIADKFSNLADGSGKTALAMRLFGESGARLIPFLNGGRSGFEELRKEAERLGIVISGDTAKAAADLNDNLARIGKQTEALRNALVENLIGPLGNVIQKMSEATLAGKGFFGTLQAPFRLNDLELAEREITSVTDRLLRSERQLAEMRRTPLSEPTAKALEASIANDRRRAEELQKLLGVLRGETNALGDPLKSGNGAKPQAPALPSTSTGTDKGAEFLESLRKRLLGIQENEFSLLRLEATQRKVAQAAEPLIQAIERETNFRKELDAARAKDDAAAEAEISRRQSLLLGVAEYVKSLEQETALMGLSAEARQVQIQLMKLEEAGISKTSEEYAAAAARIKAAVNANAGAALTRELLAPLEKANESVQRLRDLLGAGAISNVTFQRGLAAINEELTKSDDATKVLDDAVKSLGLTFTSAFEEAVAGGKSFRDILKGIESDLLKLGTRKLITEPAVKGFEGLLKNGIGGLFGNDASSVGYVNSFDDPLRGGGGGSGGLAFLGDIFKKFIGSFETGTAYVPKDGFAYLHKGERVMTAEENRRGGGMVVNQTFNIQGGPVTPQSRSQIAASALRGLEQGRRNL